MILENIFPQWQRNIGHKIEDITEKVYTQRDVNWLKEELEKIV